MVDDSSASSADTDHAPADATGAASSPGVEDHDPEGETTDTDRRRARWWVLPWLVAAVAVLVAVAATSQWLSLRAEEQTRQEVQRVAEEFVVALTTWDASDGLQDTREELREAGTGAFAAEVDELFGGTLGDELEEAEAVSEGEVEDVFVQRIQGDEAIVLGVVIQELRTNLTDTPDRTVRSARLTLTREDGRWLVSGVQLLADDAGREAPAEVVEPATETPAGTDDEADG